MALRIEGSAALRRSSSTTQWIIRQICRVNGYAANMPYSLTQEIGHRENSVDVGYFIF